MRPTFVERAIGRSPRPARVARLGQAGDQDQVDRKRRANGNVKNDKTRCQGSQSGDPGQQPGNCLLAGIKACQKQDEDNDQGGEWSFSASLNSHKNNS